MLEGFTQRHFVHARASEGARAEFGGGCPDVFRQLFREGVIPMPALAGDNSFVTLKKTEPVKFEKKEYGETMRSEVKREDARLVRRKS